jgi:hypothetical protein
MALESTVSNPALPSRRWSRPYAITTSDVPADVNLIHNGRPFKYLQNVGTGGLVLIRWYDGTDVGIYLAQGTVIEGGYWTHAFTTGTVGGADLRGFVGLEGQG